MSRTIYYTASSLDGFIATPDHSLDWLLSQPLSDDISAEMEGLTTRFGAMLMGSSTYQWMVDHEQLLDNPDAWPYAAPTWVMTHRDLPVVPGADIRFAQGEVAAVHAEAVAAAGGKEVWVVGGGDLAGQLADAGLLDQIEISYAPVTLGAGAPLLPRRLDLVQGDVRHDGTFLSATYTLAR
ncbi:MULTISPECIES: dihydrofolate reductase family protein [Mumia]|uniref:dihydrofolate reductase family protein n=1 Tax=Mumia TaxID=1546255 RepID=UPI00142024F2|nr:MULTISPECIES: dihydrofolate reductase family protein [unclassified Mumia]QMW67828.1 dihydrofolate reductase family protein [Mumia sp. ZJ1417]